MEELASETFDVVIHGTGLQSSLLALALSRSGKKILHLDQRGYYGGPDAAFSLNELESWSNENADSDKSKIFRSATFTKAENAESELGSPRSYILPLASQLILFGSEFKAKLVSSQVYRGIEFVAVGSPFIYQPGTDGAKGSLLQVPSTREDMVASNVLSAKQKRKIWSFLRLVMDFESPENMKAWSPHAQELLSDYLVSTAGIEAVTAAFIISLTLSLDGKITVEAGIKAIARYLSSMQTNEYKLAAVYPRYGGLSEVIQTFCRASAVGGAIYCLHVGVKGTKTLDEGDAKVEVTVTDNTPIKTKLFVTDQDAIEDNRATSKLIAILDNSLVFMFQRSADAASEKPDVAIVAFPVGSLSPGQKNPVYIQLHSSGTGECPKNMCVAHIISIAYENSKNIVESALSALLATFDPSPTSLVKVYYEQAESASSLLNDGNTIIMPCSTSGVAFNDELLKPVHEAWAFVTKNDEDVGEYLTFANRELVDDDE